MIRKIISTINTMHKFALKALELFVVRLIYATRKAPTPNSPLKIPDTIPIIVRAKGEL